MNASFWWPRLDHILNGVHPEVDPETGGEGNLKGRSGHEWTTGREWVDETGKGKQSIKCALSASYYQGNWSSAFLEKTLGATVV